MRSTYYLGFATRLPIAFALYTPRPRCMGPEAHSSQRRLSGAPMCPNQHGISQDRQSQTMGHGPYQLGQNHPHPSPLNLPDNGLLQYDDFFSGLVPESAMIRVKSDSMQHGKLTYYQPEGDALNLPHLNEQMGCQATTRAY